MNTCIENPVMTREDSVTSMPGGRPTNTDPRFLGIKAKVDALDLGPIKFKLTDRDEGLGWTREYAAKIEREYRNFLILAGLNSDSPAVPFGDVDKFWHFHILDTQKYAADCQIVFGRFLHHFPYLGMRGPDDEARLETAGESTQERYAALFGSRMGGSASTCDKCCGSFGGNEKADEVLRSRERPTVA